MSWERKSWGELAALDPFPCGSVDRCCRQPPVHCGLILCGFNLRTLRGSPWTTKWALNPMTKTLIKEEKRLCEDGGRDRRDTAAS